MSLPPAALSILRGAKDPSRGCGFFGPRPQNDNAGQQKIPPQKGRDPFPRYHPISPTESEHLSGYVFIPSPSVTGGESGHAYWCVLLIVLRPRFRLPSRSAFGRSLAFFASSHVW